MDKKQKGYIKINPNSFIQMPNNLSNSDKQKIKEYAADILERHLNCQSTKNIQNDTQLPK